MRLRPLALACLLLAGAPAWSTSVGSAFTYQGNLNFNGSPASGNFDFQFALYTEASGGTAVDTITQTSQTVTDGLISTSLDYTEVPFNGQALWIEVRVRPAGSGTYTILTPRQAITATPYALFALSGNQGPQGPTGAQGPAGATGATGAGGATGAMGAAGAAGLQGPPGFVTLPYNGSGSDPTAALSVTNSGAGVGVLGTSGAGTGVSGISTNGDGIQGTGINGVEGDSSVAGASGVYGQNGNVQGYGVYGRNTGGGYGVGTDGPTFQVRYQGGWVKAMARVNAGFGGGANEITRCFNSQLPGGQAAVPPCGFAVSEPFPGVVTVDFGFKVDDRFVIATGESDSFSMTSSPISGSLFRIVSIYTPSNTPADEPFVIVVF